LKATSRKRNGGNGISLVLDFGLSELEALSDDRGLEAELERDRSGRLTEASRASIRERLRGFLRSRWWRPRPALCALPANGVSIRRFRLPPATAEATRQLLHLQLEQAFPVPPTELAWGYRIYDPGTSLQTETRRRGQEVAVLAVKRETLEDYAALLAECGIRPKFTLGALAAANACPVSGGVVAVLDVGRTHSEWLRLHDGRPELVRTFAWGLDSVTAAVADRLGVDRPEAERLAREEPARAPAAVAEAIEEAATRLIRFLSEAGRSVEEKEGASPPDRLYVTGRGAAVAGLAPRLAGGLGGVDCRVIAPEDSGPGRSTVNLGLRRMAEKNGAIEPIHFHDPRTGRAREDDGRWRRAAPWIATAAGLLLLMLLVRYLPPIWKAGSVQKRIDTDRGQLAALPPIDKELAFLAHLEARQPPVLDALTVFALAAPDEAVLQEFTLNARGSISMKVLIKINEHNRLREMLTKSGWFSAIVLQNLSAAKGKFKKPRKIIDLTARLTPPPDGLEGARKRIEEARAAAPAPPGGPRPPGASPSGPKPGATGATGPEPPGASGPTPALPETTAAPRPGPPSGAPARRPTTRTVPKPAGKE